MYDLAYGACCKPVVRSGLGAQGSGSDLLQWQVVAVQEARGGEVGAGAQPQEHLHDGLLLLVRQHIAPPPLQCDAQIRQLAEAPHRHSAGLARLRSTFNGDLGKSKGLRLRGLLDTTAAPPFRPRAPFFTGAFDQHRHM